MATAFHIIVVIWFTLSTLDYLTKVEGLGEFITSLVLIFMTVWAWLHMFKVW